MTRTRVSRGARRAAAVTFLSAALVTGCLSEGSCSVGTSRGGAPGLSIGSMFGVSEASASCAAGVEYQGRFYVAWSDKLPVAKGDLLGDAVYPPCNDGSGCGADAPDTTGRPTQVWALRGVDPDRVLVGRAEPNGKFVVYGRLNADPEDYFRFAGGTWHIRAALPRDIGSPPGAD